MRIRFDPGPAVETLSLAGESGSGKSTTNARAAAGWLNPGRGISSLTDSALTR
ncbi:hypothetical protein KCP70_20570 [Salmonella enterica subsp. enterica]|nr:hypothetical protein KCP70_20570 [Salmonella enterica subsp. enterica]